MIKMTKEVQDLIYEIKRTKGHAEGAIDNLMGIYGKEFLREINYYGLPAKEAKDLVTSFFYDYIPKHFVDLSDRTDFYYWGVGILKQNAKRLHAMKKDEFKGRYEYVFAETDRMKARFRTAISSVAAFLVVAGAVWLTSSLWVTKPAMYDLAKGGSANVGNSTIVAVESSKYSVSKDGKNTTVKMQSGDLIFKVQHNDTTYKVETSLGDVTVVGTEFEVSYSSNAMSVNLYKGQVKITDKVKMTNITLTTNYNQYTIMEGKPVSSTNKVETNKPEKTNVSEPKNNTVKPGEEKKANDKDNVGDSLKSFKEIKKTK